MTEAGVREHFERQAAQAAALGSPFMERLCRVLARDLDGGTETGRRVLGWPRSPGGDALALRLCGGLHGLVLAGTDAALAEAYPPNEADDDALAAAVRGALARHDAELSRWLDGAPQTNEIGRSAMLLPGFLEIARETGLPLDLAEIGASAGLNLLFDRFHFDYAGNGWGDADSPVRLAPELRGAPPPLDGEIRIVRRAGADIAPVDIRDPDSRLRLAAYVWADQTARLRRLEAALGLAAQSGGMAARADAPDFVAQRLAGRLPGTVFVLFHSIMWNYMPKESQARIEALMEEAGRTAAKDAPLAWLRMEGLPPGDDHAWLSLTLWPGGETRRLAACDYHGRWLEWLA